MRRASILGPPSAKRQGSLQDKFFFESESHGKDIHYKKCVGQVFLDLKVPSAKGPHKTSFFLNRRVMGKDIHHKICVGQEYVVVAGGGAWVRMTSSYFRVGRP